MSRTFIARDTNQAFTCANCGRDVPALANGSYRNHCPFCLFSLHVDIYPGDRASDCGGLLEPIGVVHSAKKGWSIIHHCQRCGHEGRNRAALDDPHCPDNYELIIRLSLHPK